MSDRWVVDTLFPQGHLVPMTKAEQTQFDADQAAAAVATAAKAAAAAAGAAITAKLAANQASPAEVQAVLAKLLGG